jgi:hypothetical protein
MWMLIARWPMSQVLGGSIMLIIHVFDFFCVAYDELFGLPPMSQYDASATPMWRCFQRQADLTPYQFRKNEVLLDSKNPAGTKLAALSSKINLSEEDRVPDDFFSMIIWKAVKGEDAEMPAIHHAAFVFYHNDLE